MNDIFCGGNGQAMRNKTIDLLRALTMMLMLTVNDLWSVTGVPHWMQHAEYDEDMLGFSDIIFPSFLFCVGLSIPYAIRNMRARGKSEGDVVRHILCRSFALLLMGAFICNYESGIDAASGYNGAVYCVAMTVAFFLIYNKKTPAGWPKRVCSLMGWTVLAALLLTSRHADGGLFGPSWWGILGLIGWAYLFVALTYALVTRRRTLVVVWTLLFLVCLGSTRTAPWLGLDGAPLFPAAVNNAVHIVTNILHLGNASCALPVMSGVLFTEWLLARQRKTWQLAAVAAAFALAGLATHQLFIVSKLIGTLPWIFYVLAIDIALYLLLDRIVIRETASQERRNENPSGASRWLAPLRPAGTATLTCYMIPYVLYPLISNMIGWDWSYAIPAPFGLLKCLAFSALCILLTALLGRLRVGLKI